MWNSFQKMIFLNLTNIQKLRLSEWNAISIYQTRWLITTSTTSWAIYYQKKWQEYKKYFGRLLHPKVTKRFRDNQKFNIEYVIANFENKLQSMKLN